MLLVALIHISGFAQTKVLDTASYKAWRSLSNTEISLNGKWVKYTVSDRRDVTHFYNTETGKTQELNGTENANFCDEGNWIKYTLASGGTCFKHLSDGKTLAWKRSGFVQDQQHSPWISYYQNVKNVNSLILINLNGGDSVVIHGVSKSVFIGKGSSIVYTAGSNLYIGNINGSKKKIASDVADFEYDESKSSGTYLSAGKLYAFNGSGSIGGLLLDFNAIHPPTGFNLNPKAIDFQKGAEAIVLELSSSAVTTNQRRPLKRAEKPPFDLELWTWNEPVQPRLRTRGTADLYHPDLKFIYNLTSGTWFQLPLENPTVLLIPGNSQLNQVLYTDPAPYQIKVDYLYHNNVDVYSLNTLTGEKRLLQKEAKNTPQWSPNGRYALTYDNEKGQWLKLANGGTSFEPVSAAIPYPVSDEQFDMPEAPPAYGLAGWMDGGNSAVVYDHYDVWVIDLTGKRTPYCLTQQVGRKNKTVLRFLGAAFTGNLDNRKLLRFDSFNEITKSRGMYIQKLGKAPEKLTESADFNVKILGVANNGNVLFVKESFNVFPDLWCANDKFNLQKRITDINPQQRDFNWGTASIVSWKTFDGTYDQGLLYLPAGYDARKKYPVIVDFYEKHTDDLHEYYTPIYSQATLDIPTYVSKGYIIFRPDVHFKTGYPGESALNCVSSGTQYLIDEGIADPKKIGIQGHSFSGFEVAYILTRSSLFACANVGAGVVNMTYNYTAMRSNGASNMFKYEVEQSRIGGNLWDARDAYIRNSPILNADKITTPILIFHNDKDGAVPFSQGLDLFIAMRRLSKPAWLLNYKGENHTLNGSAAQQDFTQRLGEFFDYYLKGKPAAEWMSQGLDIK